MLIVRLTRVESEMVLAEQKAKDFEILLGKERADKEAISASYRAKLQEAKQVTAHWGMLHIELLVFNNLVNLTFNAL